MLCVVCCVLRVACCVLCVACYMLCVAICLLCIVYYVLCAACHPGQGEPAELCERGAGVSEHADQGRVVWGAGPQRVNNNKLVKKKAGQCIYTNALTYGIHHVLYYGDMIYDVDADLPFTMQ